MSRRFCSNGNALPWRTREEGLAQLPDALIQPSLPPPALELPPEPFDQAQSCAVASLIGRNDSYHPLALSPLLPKA